MVDAFLTGELLASSLAAIDLLVYVIHGERKERPIETEDYAKNLAVKKRGSEKADKEVEILKCFLLNYHNHWENTDLDVNVEMPLTADQIAEKLGWRGHPRTVASRVSRRMKEIFGKDPMKKYRQELAKGIRSKRPDGASLLYHAIVDAMHMHEAPEQRKSSQEEDAP